MYIIYTSELVSPWIFIQIDGIVMLQAVLSAEGSTSNFTSKGPLLQLELLQNV